MNIHFLVGPEGIAKVTTAQYRQRTGTRKPSKDGTKPPRSRENIGKTQGIKGSGIIYRINATKVYPGGKKLRRANAELTRRTAAHAATLSGKGINPLAYQKPGSMAR